MSDSMQLIRMCIGILVIAFVPNQFLNANDSEVKRKTVNRGVVGILGGGPDGTYIELVEDLATLLDDGYDLRILPMTSKGSVRGVEDLLYLKGVDIAFLQSDVLEYFATDLKQQFPDLDQRLRYVTRLYNEELHILARADIGSIEELNGMRVNLGPIGSGTNLTSLIILRQLGIDVLVSNYENDIALEKLKNGELDAWFRVAGKPIRAVTELSDSSELRLLSVPAARIDGPYVQASFTSADYNHLIPLNTSVATISVPAVMAAYNWPLGHPKRAKVERFVSSFRTNFHLLKQKPFHQKWLEVDLDADVAGWRRFESER